MGGRVPGAKAPCFSVAGDARTKVRAYLRGKSNDRRECTPWLWWGQRSTWNAALMFARACRGSGSLHHRESSKLPRPTEKSPRLKASFCATRRISVVVFGRAPTSPRRRIAVPMLDTHDKIEGGSKEARGVMPGPLLGDNAEVNHYESLACGIFFGI